ncbi:MAG: hypothetical protein ABJA93_01870 [Sporichthyaceae bacterium]
MSEQETPQGSTPRPIPDLGFFAGPVQARGDSSFGAPPNASGPRPGGGQFGSAPGASQFGAAPSASQFGTAPASTFGTPSALAPSYGAGPAGPPARSVSSPVKVVAIVVGLLLIVGSGTAGRFGWRHFLADPAVPDTLQGMPRLTGPSADAAISQSQDSIGKFLTSGSKAKVALYSNGAGSGFLLFAVRGSSRPGQDTSESKGEKESTYGDVHCSTDTLATGAAEAGGAATICVRTFFRRGVIVLGFGSDAITVAAATAEAWKAQ